ncbi:MAG TPA: DUF4097 family beta strand repeat-containing protein [Polyangiaceae bacterium]|jgi:hypothetical protein
MRPILFPSVSLCVVALLSQTACAAPPHPRDARDADAHPALAHGRDHESDDEEECDNDNDGEGDEEPHPHRGGGGTLEETRPVKADGVIDVHQFGGTVHVTGWNQNVLKVHARFEGDCHLEIEPSGDRTGVGLSCRHGPGVGDIEIQVPKASRLELRTMSADVTVRDMSGAQRLHTVNGDIDVAGGNPGEVEARSTSGDVTIQASAGTTRAHSVSGTIKVTGVHGRATLSTVSGDTLLTGNDFSEISVQSVSGDVVITGSVVAQGTVEAQSHSGDIVLHLPNNTNADAELRSFNGDLVVDLGSGKKTAEKELDAKIGSGGAKLRLHSFSGDVRVTR